MGTLNQWGDDVNVDEGLGDVAYEKLESKAKEGAKEGAEKVAKAAGRGLDKLTDKIDPLKKGKDAAKNLWHNNPVAKAKRAVGRGINKVKQGAKKLAKEGIKAVGKMVVNAIKGLVQLFLANPIIGIIVIVIIIVACVAISKMMSAADSTDSNQTDEYLLDSPVYVNVDGMVDDDVVVILMDDCVSQQYDTMGELDAEKEELAKSVYSVFRSYGFNNASIAGMLGNIDIESGIDPSAIEGIFSEYGFLGTRKAQALLSLTAYTENTLFPAYVRNGKSINKDGYKVIDDDNKTVYYCGIGLVQWTGENAFTLFKTAYTLDIDWYSMDFQLGYMMSDCMYRSGFFSGWVVNQEEGTDDASWIEAARNSGIKFAHDYEGNSSNDEERADAAEEWFLIIKDWDDSYVDQDYVDSITELATQLGGLIEFLDVQNARYRCLNGNIFDNSSIANAAISFAWPTNEQSKNNGTNLYQIVHDGIFPGDLIYKACDRATAMAVRWSGSDDSFPLGTSDQLRYMSGSAKWEEIGTSDSVAMDELQPGDIFILSGHVFIYTGESAITAAYPAEAKPGSDSVSASLGERSAACNNSATSIVVNNGGQDWDNRGVYHIFRCVDPDNSDTYSAIGSGVTN